MSKKTLVATYDMIKAYKNYNSNKWLAISEFIDNSISSWQGKDNPNKSTDGLVVTITFNSENEKRRKLIITDNANGMNEEELVNAMQPSDRTGKLDTHYNQYGIGMKLGIFWYGEDGIVHSKQKYGSEYKVELLTSNKNTGQEVEVESVLVYGSDCRVNYDSGTTIIIDNIHDNRYNNSNDIEEMIQALGWRYRKLLSHTDEFGIRRPGMKITIEEKRADLRTKFANVERAVKPFWNEVFTFDKFLAYRNKNFDKNRFLSVWESDINDLLNRHKGKPILTDFCNKLLIGEKLESEKEIDISGKKAVLKFGIFLSGKDASYSKNSGVTTYHIKRAINHGPNLKSNSQSNISFSSNNSIGSTGDPTWRRLFGEIDLTGVESPDQNKSKFDWRYGSEADLLESLNSVWKELSPLLKVIIKWEKDNDMTPEINKKEKDEITKISKESMNKEIIEPMTIKNPTTGEQDTVYYLKNEDIYIYINEKSTSESIDFINIKFEEKNWYITFNSNHIFWKPFISEDKKSSFRGRTVYPLIIVIALCKNALDEKSLSTSLFSSENDTKDFEQIINKIMGLLQNNGQ